MPRSGSHDFVLPWGAGPFGTGLLGLAKDTFDAFADELADEAEFGEFDCNEVVGDMPQELRHPVRELKATVDVREPFSEVGGLAECFSTCVDEYLCHFLAPFWTASIFAKKDRSSPEWSLRRSGERNGSKADVKNRARRGPVIFTEVLRPTEKKL